MSHFARIPAFPHIRTIEGQNPELSPWLSIVIAAIILFGSIAIFSSGRR